MALGILVACSPERTVGWDDEVRIGPLGEPVEVLQNVGYYPACGNELIEVDGVTWFPVRASDDSELPADPLAATPGGEAASSGPPAHDAPLQVKAAGLHMVAAPGPGDDVGTMVIYREGVAYWLSHSGNLDTWLVDEPRTYNWVC